MPVMGKDFCVLCPPLWDLIGHLQLHLVQAVLGPLWQAISEFKLFGMGTHTCLNRRKRVAVVWPSSYITFNRSRSRSSLQPGEAGWCHVRLHKSRSIILGCIQYLALFHQRIRIALLTTLGTDGVIILQLALLYVQPVQRYLLSVGLHAWSLWTEEVQLLLIAPNWPHVV